MWFLKQFKPKKARGPAVCSLSFSVLALTGHSCAVGCTSELIQHKRNLTHTHMHTTCPQNGNFLFMAKYVIVESVTEEKREYKAWGGKVGSHCRCTDLHQVVEGLCKVQFVARVNLLAKSPDTGTAVLAKQ